tara:strand:+ start:26 stop:922 length:897 start_codon:yes stop_codon:yes gene_type:complete
MTRSVYLLAFIASATVVSAEADAMTWTLTTEQACAALGTQFCFHAQYTKESSGDDVTTWYQYQTEAVCKTAPDSCYVGLDGTGEVLKNSPPEERIFCLTESTASTYFQSSLRTNVQQSPSASILKCFLPEGKTSLDDYVNTAAVGQTKAACEAAGSSCIWTYKEDKSPATDDHNCDANTNSWMAVYTANNIPAPYKAYYQWVHDYLEVCKPRTDDECTADARCRLMRSGNAWKCHTSWPYLIGLMADACPTEAEFGAKLHNTTVHGAKVATGIVSPAGDVSRGALLFAALAALLALVM